MNCSVDVEGVAVTFATHSVDEDVIYCLAECSQLQEWGQGFLKRVIASWFVCRTRCASAQRKKIGRDEFERKNQMKARSFCVHGWTSPHNTDACCRTTMSDNGWPTTSTFRACRRSPETSYSMSNPRPAGHMWPNRRFCAAKCRFQLQWKYPIHWQTVLILIILNLKFLM